MFPGRSPWGFISSYTKSSPKEKGRRERQSALTCVLQISLSRTSWPSACCRMEQRHQSQTTLEREIVGVSPSTSCLNTSPLSARGMESSCLIKLPQRAPDPDLAPAGVQPHQQPSGCHNLEDWSGDMKIPQNGITEKTQSQGHIHSCFAARNLNFI